MTTPILVLSPDSCLDMYALHLMAIGALRRAGLHDRAEELHHLASSVAAWDQMVELVEKYVELKWP